VPTYARLPRFDKDYALLSPDEKTAFRLAIRKFVDDLNRGGPFRKGLRVKGVQGSPGVFEMTWADNGRATFEYGDNQLPGEPHVVWRRVGTHAILGEP
jgi:hypothetical protein